MKIEWDKVIFTTGKIRYANGGIIGIDPKMEVTQGYNGEFYDINYLRDEEELTKAELIELADYMVSQWQKFRTLHESNAELSGAAKK